MSDIATNWERNSRAQDACSLRHSATLLVAADGNIHELFQFTRNEAFAMAALKGANAALPLVQQSCVLLIDSTDHSTTKFFDQLYSLIELSRKAEDIATTKKYTTLALNYLDELRPKDTTNKTRFAQLLQK